MREFRFPTAEEAEKAFYSAFTRASLDDMMQVWAEEEAVVCIHPMGPRLCDAASIAAAWRQIFSSGERMQIEIGETTTVSAASLAMHSVAEHILLPDGRRGTVLATNVYRLTENGWRIVLHHGSPAGGGPAPAGEEPPPRMH